MMDDKKSVDSALMQKVLSDPATLEKSFRRFSGLMAYYRCAMMEIETKFNVLNQEFSLRYDRNPIQDIRSRLKSPESVIRKLQKKGLEVSADSIEKNLADVAGVRVICSFLADVYLLADALLSQDDITLIEIKDYIKNPKSNGYRSLHLIVEVPIFLQNQTRYMKAEVQFRTIAMDFWATLEHKLRYKKDLSEAESEILSDELLICSQMSAELDQRMQTVKNKISAEGKSYTNP